jgi:hypothetical protein
VAEIENVIADATENTLDKDLKMYGKVLSSWYGLKKVAEIENVIADATVNTLDKDLKMYGKVLSTCYGLKVWQKLKM